MKRKLKIIALICVLSMVIPMFIYSAVVKAVGEGITLEITQTDLTHATVTARYTGFEGICSFGIKITKPNDSTVTSTVAAPYSKAVKKDDDFTYNLAWADSDNTTSDGGIIATFDIILSEALSDDFEICLEDGTMLCYVDNTTGDIKEWKVGADFSSSVIMRANLNTTVASGTCGDNLTWTLNDSGTLTISGTGDMTDFNTTYATWFDYTLQVKNVIINDGVTSIGSNAFEFFENLTSVSIPDSVTQIGYYAFGFCNSLERITIPSSVTIIDGDAFGGCHKLHINVNAENKVYSDIDGVLFNKDKSSLLTYRLDEVQMEYTIPSGVKIIDYDAFESCNNLTNVIMPESVTIIGERAFMYCSGLKNINIHNKVTSIGRYAFAGCSGLTDILIPNGITNIANGTFSRCSGLTSIAIPETVKNIDYMAFYECSGVINITIPISVTSIGQYAFSRCSALNNVYYGGTEAAWKGISISTENECLTLATIHYTDVLPTDISLNKTSLSLTIGSTETLQVVITQSDAANKNVIWSSSNTNVATVSSSGVVTAKAEGTAIITVETEDGRYTAECTVTVSDSTSLSLFTMLRDNYSFANTWSSFGYSNTYRIPLQRFISVFGITEGTQRYDNEGYWGGSCYGFSTTSSLFFENKLSHNQYDSSATSLFEIPAPKTPSAGLTVLMERYQIGQYLEEASKERSDNYNDMSRIIEAVKHFEETGEDPIILCVWRYGGGHAVVPYKCVTNSDGSYSIYVYDNNYPISTSRVVTISKNMDEFSYDSYNRSITFNYANTVYNALHSGLSLFSTENGKENVATLTVNSDNVNITDVNGVPIENIDGAYEVVPVAWEIDTMQKTYVVPNGDYLIQNNNPSLDYLQISISNDKDYQIITSDDLKATASVGVYASTGRVYAYINSTKTSNQSIKTLSDSGVSKLFEAVGKSLGASAANSASVEIVADSSVLVNGTTVSVGSTGDIGSASISTMVEVNGSGSGKYFETMASKNSLTYSDGTVSGKLSYLIYNNTQSLTEARIIVGLYSDDGRLVSIIKNDDEVLALGSNYIDLGTLNYFGLNKSGYKVKCFVWDSLDNMQPLAEAVETDID